MAGFGLSLLAHCGHGESDVFEIMSVELVPASGQFYEPKNETEFRELFEKLASPVFGYRVSNSQRTCPDLLLYDKNTKRTIRAEVEYRASDFFKHKHMFDTVDLIVCWINDIKESHITVLECSKKIMKHAGA